VRGGHAAATTHARTNALQPAVLLNLRCETAVDVALGADAAGAAGAHHGECGRRLSVDVGRVLPQQVRARANGELLLQQRVSATCISPFPYI
jgi:hypothetical protein